MTTDDTRTDDDSAQAEADALIGMERRRRRAFTVSLAVVAVVVAVALGYSVFRDPGPQPTVPPKITGTDDGGLKRAIVHYLGALEHKDADELEQIMGSDETTVNGGTTSAAEVIRTYGAVAGQKATVEVTAGGGAAVQNGTVTFADGRTQSVSISKVGGTWFVTPDRPTQD